MKSTQQRAMQQASHSTTHQKSNHKSTARPSTDGAEQQANRLLMALAQENAEAIRGEDSIIVSHSSKGARVAGGRFSFSALAMLLESGAVLCLRRNGQSVFRIGDAGHARLARLHAQPDECFAAQHRIMETVARNEGDQRETLRINRREDPLDLLRRYRDKSGAPLCGQTAFAAADRLRNEIAAAQAVPPTTSNWSRLVVDGGTSRHGLSMSERQVAARARLEAALKAVGPEFANILLDICGFSKGLEVLEREHGWPIRSGKVIVSFALKALARHYGMDEAAQGNENAIMQFWADADYRPQKMGGGE